jgi:hypothetical protein
MVNRTPKKLRFLGPLRAERSGAGYLQGYAPSSEEAVRETHAHYRYSIMSVGMKSNGVPAARS